MRISTIINYCSNEKRFIDQCINSVLDFSTDVIVPVSTHLFDGTPENIENLQEDQARNPEAQFLIYNWQEGKPARYWHNYSRLIAARRIQANCDWMLFLDADEIIDTKLFKKFIPRLALDPSINSYKLANYWYFREPFYRANAIEDSIVIVRSEYACNIDLDDRHREREQFEFYNTPRNVMVDNIPLAHHYSWVRTKEEMLKKVQSWGHNQDKDWISLVEEEFSRPFNGKCFVNNYSFEKLTYV